MTITIGERTLATRRTSDLDAKLVAATGCNVAEHAEILATNGTPFQIARALAPMLTGADTTPVADLAEMIEAADPLPVRLAVVALLGGAPEPGGEVDAA